MVEAEALETVTVADGLTTACASQPCLLDGACKNDGACVAGAVRHEGVAKLIAKSPKHMRRVPSGPEVAATETSQLAGTRRGGDKTYTLVPSGSEVQLSRILAAD